MNWLRAPIFGEPAPPLWLLVILTGCGTLPVHILVPAMPAAARELGVSNGTIQLAITLYLVGLAAGQLIYGTLVRSVRATARADGRGGTVCGHGDVGGVGAGRCYLDRWERHPAFMGSCRWGLGRFVLWP